MKASDYAHAMGADTSTDSAYEGNCCWWLRSPGMRSDYAANVLDTGHIRDGGYYQYYVTTDIYAVVPALHINLSSDLWSVADDGSSGEGGGGGTGTGDVTTVANNDIAFQVYDIGDGNGVLLPPAMKDATVNVEKFGSAATDAQGKAVIENTLTDQPLVNAKISIIKEGCRQYYFYKDIYNKDAELLWNSNQQTVYMRKLQEGDESNPYISTLMCQNFSGKSYDAMTP